MSQPVNSIGYYIIYFSEKYKSQIKAAPSQIKRAPAARQQLIRCAEELWMEHHNKTQSKISKNYIITHNKNKDTVVTFYTDVLAGKKDKASYCGLRARLCNFGSIGSS